MYSKGIIVCIIVTFVFFLQSLAQTSVSGFIQDRETGELIVGANVQLKGTYMGTISDPAGEFVLRLEAAPPFQLVVSALGYTPKEVEITEDSSRLAISLSALQDSLAGVLVQAKKVENVVVAGSKLLENKLNSPVAIQKLGLLSLRNIPSADIIHGLSFLPEVQVNVSSLSHATPNTRGFSDAQNWRFVQFLDGAEMVSPGLNYPLNNIMAPSELDLSNIELIAGPGSVLYGPNVFNGVMLTTTKSPFDYQGVSAYVKGGVTVQKNIGNNPYREIGLRVAKAFNDKFAGKFNVAYMGGTDWAANDDEHFKYSFDGVTLEELQSLPRSHPTYDAVNVYGDEFTLLVPINGTEVLRLSRSGIAERDLIDYRINNVKLNGALHYRFNRKTELIYDGKFNTGDAIVRHTVALPIRDYQHHTHKIELRSGNSYFRSYYIQENLNNSYNSLSAANYIQNQLKPNLIWAGEYLAAFKGEVPDIPGADHEAARAFADRDVMSGNSAEFQRLLNETINNPDNFTGGSKYGGNSYLIHAEANYEIPVRPLGINLQTGGNLRKYTLQSQGNVYNDGPDGFNAPIPISEFGAYFQLYRFFAQQRIKLQLTGRYDKNNNYKGAITPRASLIVGLDKNERHVLRFSTQTGFRNPASLESFSRFNSITGNLMGGAEENVNNYSVRFRDSTYNGRNIFEQLVTLPSAQAFGASGFTDPSLLEFPKLNFLRPEKISTLSAGYSGRISDHFTLNLNGYLNEYEGMIFRYLGYSLLVENVYAIFTNIDQKVSSHGINANIEAKFSKNFRLRANYDYLDFNAKEAMSNNPAFFPSFNSPNHRASVSLDNRDFYKGLGFAFHYMWSDSYLYQSLGGEGEIESFSQLDGALSYKIESIRSTLKVGGSNLLNQGYRTIYGGPYVGALYYVSVTIDDLTWEKEDGK